MEPERKIEKLLRAYAKKRRVDAGDPLKLHPATRRLLQAEVARKKPMPDEEESVTLWELFRQRWALLTGFAAIIFFGAALLMPALSSSKKKAQSMAAVNNLKQIGMAAQMVAEDNHGRLPASLDALTNEFVSDKELTDPETGKRFIYPAAGGNLNGLSSNAVLAYSPAEKKGRAVLFADGRVEVVNGDRLSELTNQSAQQFAANDFARRSLAEMPAAPGTPSGNAGAISTLSDLAKSESDRKADMPAELAASAPAAASPARTRETLDKDLKVQPNPVQFTSTPSQNYATQNSFKNTAIPVKTQAVLANFQVSQNGNAIRVVDADGSVYDGSLQPESTVAQKLPQSLAQGKSAVRPDELQAVQNISFKVAGMNRTLQQNVVFAGNVVERSGANANRQQSQKNAFGGSQSQQTLTNQLPWSDSFITGTAVVADTNSIEINAEPQSP